MNPEGYLRKLSPLMPERVRHWRHLLEVTQGETRRLLEHQIARTAHERLGDPHGLFLSLPPRGRARGPFHLGTIHYGTGRWPLGLSPSELIQHTGIYGRSGAGKTNLAFHLILQLARKGIPVVFLDWKQTCRHLLPQVRGRVFTPGSPLAAFPFDPFRPPPRLDPTIYANQLVDVLGDAYTLGDASRHLLQTTFRAAYEEDHQPSLALLTRRLQQVPDRERVRGWKSTALRALAALSGLHLDTRHEILAPELTQGLAVVELDGLAPSQKKFLVPLLSYWLYQSHLRTSPREHLNQVVVIEEAHHVLYERHQGRESLMEMLLRQAREAGIAIIVIDQHPHLLSTAALGNTYTSICLNLKDPKDITKAARLSLLPPEDVHHLSTLPVGHAIVKLQDRWHQPILIETPHVPVQKGTITDARLHAHQSGRRPLSAPARPETPKIGGMEGSRPHDETRLLEDVMRFPDDGVDARYKRLGLSADKGTRLKRHLIHLNLLHEERVQTGQTTRVLLRLTPRGQEMLGQEQDERRASLAHEYWKRHYATTYQARGYKVELEAARPAGGHVDVLASRDGERVAIEVETGKSDPASNVRKDLLSGYDRVLIVATTERAWIATHRALKRAGLLLPRVALVLQGRQPHARAACLSGKRSGYEA